MSTLTEWAVQYAQRGIPILPLFPLRKTPAIHNGSHGATTDLAQVTAWWKRNPNYNIGIACGVGGLLVFDFDTYKTGVQVDALFDEDDLVDTIISHTANGGTHVWMAMPEGMRHGNGTGTLPAGIDVRGYGGYIVAPPSVLEGGKTYSFAPEHSLADAWFGSVRPGVIEHLNPTRPETPTSAQPTTATAEDIATLLSHIPPHPGYAKWVQVGMAIHDSIPDKEGLALWREWSPETRPGECRNHWRSFGNYKGKPVTVATLFKMALENGYTPPVDEDLRETFTRVKEWLDSGEAVRWLRTKKRQGHANMLLTLRILVDMAAERGTRKVYAPCREVANMMAVSPMAISRRYTMMEQLGILTKEDSGKGQTLDLSPLLLVGSVIDYTSGNTVSHPTSPFISQHMGDDAFTSYPYPYAQKRRARFEGNTVLMASLGATGLHLWEYIKDGGTIAELAEASGFSKATVRNVIRRYKAAGLLEVDDSGSALAYSLVDNAEGTLDGLRPHMVTRHVGQLRVARGALATADYAALRLRQRKKMTPKDVLWWENLRDDKDRVASIIFDHLEANGFDGRMKVGKEKKVRHRIKVDHGEEWRTWGRPLFDAYTTLSGDQHDKVRQLTIANVGETSEDVFHFAYMEMREKVEAMLSMSLRRVQYERVWNRPSPQEDVIPVQPQQNLRPMLLEVEA